MECWESQPDVAKVTIAILEVLAAGFAEARLAGNSLSIIP
jgi:hypothetical protein